MKINYTKPDRLHLIVSNLQIYVSLRLFQRCFHYQRFWNDGYKDKGIYRFTVVDTEECAAW